MPQRSTIISVAVIAAILVAVVAAGAYFLVRAKPHAQLSKPQAPQANVYAALGDSVAGGTGLPGVANPSAIDKACNRSSQAYPVIVASKLSGKPAFINATCGGATAANLATSPQTLDNLRVAPQLDKAFSKGTPKVITVTVGANDMSWINIIRECFEGTCNTDDNTQQIAARLKQLSTNLHAALGSIQTRSHGNPPKVIITSYYHIIGNPCQQEALTDQEVTWIGAQTDALNTTLRAASEGFSFTKFVPLDFSGHELCTAEPWVQNPLSDPAGFHPNEEGQKAIARAILKAN